MKPGINRIAAERLRQTTAEGFDTTHDAQHAKGELIHAAVIYLKFAFRQSQGEAMNPVWPWGDEWLKLEKGNPIRALEKAGALIAAEIDRLEQQNARGVMTVEMLAQELHEAGRAAVQAGQTVAHSMKGEQSRAFIEWDDLSPEARQGRIVQAEWFLGRFSIRRLAGWGS